MKLHLFFQDDYGSPISDLAIEFDPERRTSLTLRGTQQTYLIAKGLTEAELVDREIWAGVQFRAEVTP